MRNAIDRIRQNLREQQQLWFGLAYLGGVGVSFILITLQTWQTGLAWWKWPFVLVGNWLKAVAWPAYWLGFSVL